MYERYEDIPNDVLTRTITNLAMGQGVSWVLALPGVYEIVAEELNNEALERLCPEPKSELVKRWESARRQVERALVHLMDGNKDHAIVLEWALVRALALLPWEGLPVEEVAEEVIDLFDGVPHEVFRTLDEQPGRYGYKMDDQEWHWKLRWTRNHDPRLFKVLV